MISVNNMRIKYLIRLLPIFLVIMGACVSEGPDDSGFESIPVKIVGMEFIQSDDGFEQHGNLPASGGAFNVVSTSEYDKKIYVFGVVINGVRQLKDMDFSGDGPFLEEPLLEGDWGKIEYVSQGDRNKVDVTVNPNTSSEERDITILIGSDRGGPNQVGLYITQEGTSE